MTDDPLLIQAKKLIIKHEDLKQFPYVDTTGHITIGVGYNLTTRGLPLPIIMNLCDTDIQFHIEELNKYLWFQVLNDARKTVLIDMAFNLGQRGLMGLTSVINALQKRDYDATADAMLNEKWAHQVKSRAIEDAQIMRSGILKD